MYSLHLAVVPAFLLASAAAYGTIVIDFESNDDVTVTQGTVLDDEYGIAPFNTSISFATAVFDNLGFLPTASGDEVEFFDSAEVGKVIMAFDTGAEPISGEDDDLATEDQGLVLIISEDGDSSDPDDNAFGGVVRFSFDLPTTLFEATVLDVEEDGAGFFALYEVGGESFYEFFAIPAGPDGNLETIDFGGLTNVTQLDLYLPGSGAVPSLTFQPIPELSTLNFLIATGVALGLVAFRRRK